MNDHASPRLAAPPAAGLALGSLAAWSLGRREIVRFFRQRNRIVGAVGTPLVFWLLFGAGLHRSFRLGDGAAQGPSFLAYYMPGSVVLILLFTAIFSTISIIEDRREGFLQSVLVAPAPRWSLVLGKIAGGTLIALAQGLIFLLLALTIQREVWRFSLLAAPALLLASAAGLTGLGFVLAWRSESTQGFHAVMNLLLMPLWLLSGAFFPIPAWSAGAAWSDRLLHVAMRANPVTYAVAGLRQLAGGSLPGDAFWTPGLPECWIVTCLFAAVAFAAACVTASRGAQGDLQ